MRKVGSLLTVLMLVCALAYGQTRNVTGVVRDANGNPIPFATVTESGTRNAVKADANGTFTIKIADNARLDITATGFQAVTGIASTDAANISLTVNPQQMQEVVVTTALGQQRQSRELGYSTTKVRAAELNQARVVNLQNGLTGKVSGLNVQTVNNGVFADTRILLRGIRSLTGNNQPILILDGVPISLGYINSINPNDIADVNILKSATATAIYGSDGVNGAIVVTTRRGNKNRPTITVSSTTQMESVSFLPKMQTLFGSGSSVDANGYGVYDPIENQQYGPAFDGSMVQIGWEDANGDKQMVPYSPLKDEKRKFWDRGITQQTDASYSTGDFYLSAQHVQIRGIVPGDENRRITARLSANKEYNKFKARFSGQFVDGKYDVASNNAYWEVLNTAMHVPLTRYKDWRNNKWANPNLYFNSYYDNPYFIIDNSRSRGNSADILGDVQLDFAPVKGINLTYRLGGTYNSYNNKNITNAFNYNDYAKNTLHIYRASTDITASANDGTGFSSRINSEIFGTARKDMGDFGVEALLGHLYRQTSSKGMSIATANLGIPSVFNISSRVGEPIAAESNVKTRLQRFMGRLNFNYRNWAFLEVSGNYEYSSLLASPTDFDYGDIGFFYPGVSGSIVLNEAITAIKNSKSISYLKLRGAIAKTGNVNLSAYGLENTFSPAGNFPYGTLLGFTASNTLRASSYEPEFVKTTEVGVELGFLRNRINLEATAYQQDNSNQIINVSYSNATGYSGAVVNAANFVNKGVELDLRLTPLVKLGDVNVDFKVNYSYQTNEVTSLADGVNELGIGNGNYVIVGKPAYTFKLTDYNRDDQGRIIVDRNTGYPSANPNLVTFGQTLPKHLLGLSLNAGWKGLSLAVVGDYRAGNQVYHGIGPDMDFTGISYRSGRNFRQPFIVPNSSYDDGTGKYVANTDIYVRNGGYGFYESAANNRSINSNYLTSGAFWKLRELAISYAIPQRLVSKTRAIKNATITLTGRNLVTWLPKTNEWTDPEFSNTTGNAQGVNSTANTPPTRIFGANLTLNF